MSKKKQSAKQRNPGRVTAEDLAQCVYSPNDDRDVALTPYEQSKIADKELVVYTILGQQHDLDEDGFPVLYDVEFEDGQIEYAEDKAVACAKASSFRGRTKYYVKAGYGGQLYNPVGLYEGGGRTSNVKRLGRHQYNWIEVNKKCFEFYLQFLKNKVARHLQHAQREII